MSKPLPRDRPLWQVCIADRLDDGRIGVVGKAHHCMVDGIAAVELPRCCSIPTPIAPPPEPDGWAPEPPPGDSKLLARGLVDLARSQLDLAAIPARAARSPRRAARARRRAARRAAPRCSMRRVRPRRPRSSTRRSRRFDGSACSLGRSTTWSGSRDASASSSTTSCWPLRAGGVRAFLQEARRAPEPPQDDGAGQRPRVRRGRRARQPDLVHVRRPSLRRARPGAPAARDPRRDQRPQARRASRRAPTTCCARSASRPRRSSAWSRA